VNLAFAALWASAQTRGHNRRCPGGRGAPGTRGLAKVPCLPYLKDLPFLADSGYEGADAGVHVPVKKPARGELDPDTKTRNALLRSLRYQGERGFALRSQRWRPHSG
jgi:DDE superfamily endonuclease